MNKVKETTNARIISRRAALQVIGTGALLVSSVAMPSFARAQETHTAGKTIVDIASAAGNFKWLTMLVEIAGLTDALKHGNFTVFAPTDAAFTQLPSSTLDALLKPENRQMLINILTYHVVPGSVKAAQVVDLTSAKTVEGDPVAIKVTDGKVYVNNAQVVQTDIVANNGVIHVIDSVLLPPAK